MASALHVFGPYELDPATRRLTLHGEPIVLSSRQFDVLLLLVAHAGQLLSKDRIIEAAWAGVAVTDNSLEQAISSLRRVLGPASGAAYIETVPRQGYRFAAEVRRVDRRAPPETLEAMLAPHKAWIEGRAALETLERPGILHARDVFARVLDQVPDQAPAHVGLANACVMQFEMTRVDPAPDRSALALAIAHAREACRLDPRYGEAWATLGFVLDRADQRGDALAASRMAVSLEPDNWRHRLRLAYVGWGEERLREARRTLALLPGFPLAHWLAATVLVARQALDEADRELAHGIEAHGTAHSRFSSIALHWLHGLVLLARGDDEAALRRLDEELAAETTGHLYARECCANAWYAIGAIRWRRGDRDGAVAAFEQTLSRVAVHPLARAALGVLGLHTATADVPSGPVDLAHARAVAAALSGDVAGAVGAIEAALADAPPGSALWTLPVDPILRPRGDERWASALARLRNRAA